MAAKGKTTKREAFEQLADRALLSGDEEVAMAFLLSHKHLLRNHPTRVLTERWIKQYPSILPFVLFLYLYIFILFICLSISILPIDW
jgi:hypothetical protein